MPTPVDVWAPPFEWMAELTVESTFVYAFDLRTEHPWWCKLCEARFPTTERARHVAHHRRERKSWRDKRAARVKREAADRLRELHRLKKENARERV